MVFCVRSLFVAAHDGRTYSTSIWLMILRQHQRSSYHIPFRITNATIIRTIYRSARSHTAARSRTPRKRQQLELGSVTDRHSFSRTLACISPMSMHEIYGSNDCYQYTPFNIGYQLLMRLFLRWMWHGGCLKNEIGTGWSGEREIHVVQPTHRFAAVCSSVFANRIDFVCALFCALRSFVCCHSRATEDFSIDRL